MIQTRRTVEESLTAALNNGIGQLIQVTTGTALSQRVKVDRTIQEIQSQIKSLLGSVSKK